LAVAVGKSAEQGIAGAMTANVVKTAVRAHARYHRQAERVLEQVNLTLWTGSAGDQRAGAFCGLIETATGRVCCASAGRISAVRLHKDGWQSLGQQSIGLGESPEPHFEQFGHELPPGDVLVIFTGPASDEARVAEALQGQLHRSADELVAAVRPVLAAPTAADAPSDADHCRDVSVLVVKRRG
jgi:serine phosphatase RsbU (regulator of sigma subunit)